MKPHPPHTERRQTPRIRLQVPLFLRGVDEAGREFVELSKTIDISSTGACLVTKRSIGAGQLLQITIPVSSEHGSGLIPPETPPIQARVRRTSEIGETRVLAAEFLKPLD